MGGIAYETHLRQNKYKMFDVFDTKFRKQRNTQSKNEAIHKNVHPYTHTIIKVIDWLSNLSWAIYISRLNKFQWMDSCSYIFHGNDFAV